MPAPPNAAKRNGADASAPRTTYTDLGDGSLSGNLTRDPELRFTPDGRAVATMRVAETERVYDQERQQWGDGATSFYDVVAWGDMASHASDDLAKGDRIAAVGKWQRQDWTDNEGVAKTKTVLVARDIGPSLLFRRVTIHRERPAEGG